MPIAKQRGLPGSSCRVQVRWRTCRPLKLRPQPPVLRAESLDFVLQLLTALGVAAVHARMIVGTAFDCTSDIGDYGRARSCYSSAMARDPAVPVSTRYPSDTLGQLDRRARSEGRGRSALIQRYVAEGLEMDEYPGIVFRSGPAGRRPGLMAGPDLWEVVAVFRSFEDVTRTADWLDQPSGAIETALRYYEDRRSEIDDWIRRNEEAAEAAERIARARPARP